MARSVATGQRFSRAYPGDSPDKCAARLFLYKCAVTAPRLGHAVTLAGPNPAAEVVLMRDYLKWPGNRTWFVDWARDTETRASVMRALASIKTEWPAANVVRGDVRDVIERLPMIGFAHLDYMGFMDRDNMQPGVQRTLERLAPGGVLGLTWFRGREWDLPHRSAYDVLEHARDMSHPNDRRWVGLLRMVAGWALRAGMRLDIEGALEYQHKHATMSVAVWRRT